MKKWNNFMGELMDMSLHNNDEIIKQHSRFANKLMLFSLIMTSIICIGPTGWLIFKIETNETEGVLGNLILAIITIVFMVIIWCRYFYNIKIEKLERQIEELENKF